MVLWRGLDRFHNLLMRKAPYRYEIDLVGRIAFRELDYAGEPDGLPLDPAAAVCETTRATTVFEAEPYDLVAEMPKFSWPTVVVSGGRDLTTLAIATAVRRGELDGLASRASALDALPGRPALRLLRRAIAVVAAAESALPWARRRFINRVHWPGDRWRWRSGGSPRDPLAR